ncbi:MAG: SDR family NAD(P)-dependent oxidoreductase [Leptolyngbyaceae cyanobacterium RM2_2_21]|nr:SDR family NAD(P)-dependent oxidoreductase [Leptolyngbyaceae cyanobacterium RM2_2_21]NJN04936.1 SDR family NAD(P)-dependent oxidoreductase [Leptolyngbyaceae cyanobacterium RM1_1_2]
MKMQQHTVLVTGGGSGIGLALAKKLIAAESRVAITGRSLTKLKKAQAAVPGLAIIQSDVTIEEDRLRLVHEVEERLGGLSLLVNAAGAIEYTYFSRDPEFYNRVRYEMEINYFAPIRLIELLTPLLSKNIAPGILTVSSGAAYVPVGMTAGYSASKSAIHMFLSGLRYQFQNSERYAHIKLFEACPPPVDTNMANNWEETTMMKKMSPEMFAKHVIRGLERDKYIMNIGISRWVYWLSRIAPSFVERTFNQQMESLIPVPDFSKPDYRKVAQPIDSEKSQDRL